MTNQFQTNQTFTSEFKGQIIIKQINNDYYGNLSYLVSEKNEDLNSVSWYNEAQLENLIADYSYTLNN